MGNTWDHVAFREYVLDSAARVGYAVENTADLSRITGIPAAPLSKWFRGLEQPSVANLRKLATRLKAPLGELLVAAGRGTGAELEIHPRPPVGPLPDPLAREIDRLLRDDSPLPDDVRTTYRATLEMLTEAIQIKWVPKGRKGNKPA